MANRIALLKQEEMKTWKKIEETKKRTNEISHLKKRNEEKVQKVSFMPCLMLVYIESDRHSVKLRKCKDVISTKLHDSEATLRRKKEDPRSNILVETGRS